MNFQFDVNIYGNFEKISPVLSKARVRIFYSGLNRNFTYITEEFGEKLLKEGERLMEVKILGAMPMWLSEILSELSIFPVGFSKYGNALYKVFSLILPGFLLILSNITTW